MSVTDFVFVSWSTSHRKVTYMMNGLSIKEEGRFSVNARVSWRTQDVPVLARRNIR